VTRLDVLVADDAHVVATWQRILILVWRGAPTASASARVNALAAAFVAASPLPATSLWVVEAKSPPGDAARKNLAAYSRDLVAQMRLAVVVAEGSGFRGALVRGVGAALTSILPHRSRFKFVDDVAAAAELMAPHLAAGSGGPEELLSVIADARAHLVPA
jgi:hypothetical protein